MLSGEKYDELIALIATRFPDDARQLDAHVQELYDLKVDLERALLELRSLADEAVANA